MVAELPVEVGDLVTADLLEEIAGLTSYTSFVTTPIQPLVSAAGTDTLITTVTVDFISGYAYEVFYTFPVQFTGGTSPFNAYAKIRRTNAAGTVIHDPGGTAAVTTNFVQVVGECMLKCTAGDTTQTLALIGGFSTSGSPTSMDVEAASTRRAQLRVKRVGYAEEYDALEVPTA